MLNRGEGGRNEFDQRIITNYEELHSAGVPLLNTCGDREEVEQQVPEANNTIRRAMQILHKQHTQVFDDSQSHLISFDAFCERISFLRDSGVGCDSLLYSCWLLCHDEARFALYKLYLHLQEFKLNDVESSFLDSRLVFIQKGRIDVDQSGNCKRHPKKTRPLNLANTDCKIISCMVSLFLSSVCSKCITSLQAGGMKGKQMIDLIFTLEAKVIDFIVRNVPNSGIFALDIASAFPSLSISFLGT